MMLGSVTPVYNSQQLHTGMSKLTSPYADVPGQAVAPPAPPAPSPNHWVLWAVGGVVVGGGLYLLFK